MLTRDDIEQAWAELVSCSARGEAREELPTVQYKVTLRTIKIAIDAICAVLHRMEGKVMSDADER